jgi:hypothetical protein
LITTLYNLGIGTFTSISPFLRIAIVKPISSISILETVLTLEAFARKAVIFYILDNLFSLLLSLLYELVSGLFNLANKGKNFLASNSCNIGFRS